jgi:hypothetical protein
MFETLTIWLIFIHLARRSGLTHTDHEQKALRGVQLDLGPRSTTAFCDDSPVNLDGGRRLLMIDAGFTIAAAKLRSRIVLAHTFDPDLQRRAGLAAIGRKAVPVIPNELTGARSVLTFDHHGKESLGGAIYVELGVGPEH